MGSQSGDKEVYAAAFPHNELTQASRTEHADHLDATAALMRWAKRRRGFEYSAYRAQLWEFVVEIVDAALWLGWLFPQIQRKPQTVPGSAKNRE